VPRLRGFRLRSSIRPGAASVLFCNSLFPGVRQALLEVASVAREIDLLTPSPPYLVLLIGIVVRLFRISEVPPDLRGAFQSAFSSLNRSVLLRTRVLPNTLRRFSRAQATLLDEPSPMPLDKSVELDDVLTSGSFYQRPLRPLLFEDAGLSFSALARTHLSNLRPVQWYLSAALLVCTRYFPRRLCSLLVRSVLFRWPFPPYLSP